MLTWLLEELHKIYFIQKSSKIISKRLGRIKIWCHWRHLFQNFYKDETF